MSGGDKSSKTEEATDKKLTDARKEGQVAKSQEVSAWLSVLAMSFFIPWTGQRGADRMSALLRQVPDVMADPDEGRALGLLARGLQDMLVVVLPMAVALTVIGVLGVMAQIGLKPSPKALKPKFKKLNPVPGLKKMLGKRSLWGGTKELIKLVLLSALAYRAVDEVIPLVATAGTMTLTAVLVTVGEASLSFIRATAALGLVLAAADLIIERRLFKAEQRMTKKEVRDEHKSAEGDPQLKGAIRSKQLAMSRNRMMAEIAGADVVLVNPTHVAVALRYKPGDRAPTVVAKGAGVVAARIREKATEHRVPLVRDVPLARAVHAACDLGDPVPVELYGAVAQVLAFVFSLRARGSAAGLHALPRSA